MENFALTFAMLAGPAYLAALAALLWVAWRRRGPEPRPPSPWWLVLLLALPWTLVAWALLVVRFELDPRPVGWSAAVLSALVLPVLGAASWTVARWEAARASATLCALAALCGTGAAWLLGMRTLDGGPL